MNYHFRNLLPIAVLSFLLTFGACSTTSSTDNTNDKSVSSAPEEVKVEVDVCKCLTEAGDSNYMVRNGAECDKINRYILLIIKSVLKTY